MADEHLKYTAGKTILTASLKGWNIRLFVCYDLRFPVWCRNSGNAYDLAVYIANWPERRSEHWRTLLKARAIENQAYVVGVNRIGTDGMGTHYRGDSSVFDPLGRTLFHNTGNEVVQTVTLNYEALTAYRKKFPVWQDDDSFRINI
jgi:predicted amidohydrolase